ncbi:MAG: Na/Pi cotransporter family protein [Candidatus Cloacimonetes bacterium]|nr:Na/Pi cotransporter family protein [Candidatus Cloacimonadota bacterium]
MKKLLIILLTLISIFPLFGYQIEQFGDKQNGKIKQYLNEEFGVVIRDSLGRAVSGIPVYLRSVDNCIFTDTLIYTNNRGIASSNAKMGSKMTDYHISASFELDGHHFEKLFVFTAFDYKNIVFFIIGGLGLFLLGIKRVSDSLRFIAGNKLKSFLEVVIRNRILGVGVGLSMTALLQSSSATTVITLGFINAGLISLRQAITIVLGANIGTTITAQIIAFKIGDFSLPMIALGTALYIFSKNTRTKYIGNIIFGFGFIFLGLEQMTGVVKPLSSSIFVRDFFLNFSHSPLLAIIAGTLMTVIVQSSSATVGVTIALAVGGLIDLNAAMGLVLGDNIGTTITAVLASLGSNTNAKRTALVHVLFNLVGATYMYVALLLFGGRIADFVTGFSGNGIARQIANFHSLFNITNTIVFLPFVGLLEKMVLKILPDSDKMKSRVTKYISQTITDRELAINQTKLELGRMLQNTRASVRAALKSYVKGDLIAAEETRKLEDQNDVYQLEITDYIIKLSQLELDEEQAEYIPVLIHTVNDFEKIADFARNIADIAERRQNKSIILTDEQVESILVMQRVLKKMFDCLLVAFENTDLLKAKEVAYMENQLNEMEYKFKKKQIRSLSEGSQVQAAIMTMDIYSNIEKMGNHLFNVTQAVMGKLSEDARTLYSESLFNNTLQEEM